MKFVFGSKIDKPSLQSNKELKASSVPNLDIVEYLQSQKVEEDPKIDTARSEIGKDFCFICCSDPPNMVFVDCGHGGVCTRCTLEAISKNSQCPLCRNPVTKIVEIEREEDGPKDLFKVVNTFYVSSYDDDEANEAQGA